MALDELVGSNPVPENKIALPTLHCPDRESGPATPAEFGIISSVAHDRHNNRMSPISHQTGHYTCSPEYAWTGIRCN